MIDLDELLTTRGNAWQQPETTEPDLKRALARSAARRNGVISGTLVGVVGVAVLGTAAVLGRPAPIPAVPGPVLSATGMADPAGGGAIAPSALEVEDVTREVAARFGIAASAQTVITTWADVRPLLRVQPTEPPAAEAPVWLVVVRGEFNCDNCVTGTRGPEAASRTLTVVLDAGSMREVHVEGSDQPVDLAKLGPVVDLKVAG